VDLRVNGPVEHPTTETTAMSPHALKWLSPVGRPCLAYGTQRVIVDVPPRGMKNTPSKMLPGSEPRPTSR